MEAKKRKTENRKFQLINNKMLSKSENSNNSTNSNCIWVYSQLVMNTFALKMQHTMNIEELLAAGKTKKQLRGVKVSGLE